ncbi:MAG: TetR/AcrR family transcriptional regulator, partial [Verrucomicrobiales bacterium]
MSAETTKEKLIEAAAALFAERGFREVTVEEICGRAGANLAAVNYHFRSKSKLLLATLRHAFELAEAEYPLAGGGEEAERRLFHFMNALIRRGFDPGPAGIFERMMSREGTREAAGSLVFDEVNRLQGRILKDILQHWFPDEESRIFHQARLN